MQARLTKEKAFELWRIPKEIPDIEQITSKQQRNTINNYINEFPIFKQKSGMLVFPGENNFNPINPLDIVFFICHNIFEKITKTIRILHVVDYMIEAIRFSDYAEDMLKNANDKISSGDFIIFNEIAPIKYTDKQNLLLYKLISSCTFNKKPFIITANNTIEKITDNLSDSTAKLISTHTTILPLKMKL